MRKIEERMVEAVKSGRSFSLGNTRVEAVRPVGAGSDNFTHQSAVYLHGNLIAVFSWKYHGLGILRHPSYTLELVRCTLAGWGTVTTRSRLNAICQGLGMRSRFGQRNHQQTFDDQVIDSNDWVTL